MTVDHVESCDAVARVSRHEGKVLSPPVEMTGVGRMAVVSDPTGVVFGVIEPAPRG